MLQMKHVVWQLQHKAILPPKININYYRKLDFSQDCVVRIHLSDNKLMKSGIPKKGSEATPEAGDNKKHVINSIISITIDILLDTVASKVIK